jgi:transcriptional regulator with XRE-family HTH domain
MPILAGPDPYELAAQRINLIGADLQATVTRRNITTVQAADEIGIGRTTLTGLIAGTTNPTRSTIDAALHWLATHN